MMKKIGGLPFILWTMLFILLPILIITYYSVTLNDGTLTLEHFKMFFDGRIIGVVGRSFYTAAVTTMICLLIGYPLAFLMTKVKPVTEKFLVVLLVLPMWMNFLLRTYAWQAILGKNGIINALLTFFNLPNHQLLFSKQQ